MPEELQNHEGVNPGLRTRRKTRGVTAAGGPAVANSTCKFRPTVRLWRKNALVSLAALDRRFDQA